MTGTLETDEDGAECCAQPENEKRKENKREIRKLFFMLSSTKKHALLRSLIFIPTLIFLYSVTQSFLITSIMPLFRSGSKCTFFLFLKKESFEISFQLPLLILFPHEQEG